ncbi:MAG: hypothetical protein KGZ88_05355 [Methylomicrobium sp.]|nr:hypothetical protein [Methylomicrobium sp.]
MLQILILALSLALSACGSISKGVTEALLEKSTAEDNKVCQVWGQPFSGIEPMLDKPEGMVKMLMVHGVGDHIPGYSSEFMEKLAKELGLNSRSGLHKDITLTSTANPDQKLGNLRATHLLNEETGQKLTFYELTWSDITREAKAMLAFDNSGENDFRRAQINDMLKKFSNDTSPDPFLYLGSNREQILQSFTQAFCWMSAYDWEGLPDSGKQSCIGDQNSDTHVIHDEYVFVSHSLGSRIAIDGLQYIAAMLPQLERYLPQDKKTVSFSNRIEGFRNQRIKLFMLSNQLPMLQMGRELPEITNRKADYCEPDSPNFKQRMVSETEIYAFSDPNDLLSYSIPKGFSEKYLDARLCSTITNININVTTVLDVFGMSNFANPVEAHVAYDQDDRVIALIARGIGTKGSAPLVQQKCEFIKINQ